MQALAYPGGMPALQLPLQQALSLANDLGRSGIAVPLGLPQGALPILTSVSGGVNPNMLANLFQPRTTPQ